MNELIKNYKEYVSLLEKREMDLMGLMEGRVYGHTPQELIEKGRRLREKIEELSISESISIKTKMIGFHEWIESNYSSHNFLYYNNNDADDFGTLEELVDVYLNIKDNE